MIVPTTITPIYKQLREAWNKHRTFILYGGSSSSKTVTILQHLSIYAQQNKNKVVTLVAESYPVLKKTLIADWKTLVMKGAYDPRRFNGTDMEYTFQSGSKFQFMPADDESRFHGPRRDVLYLDEVFFVKKQVYDQASIRTREKVIMSFNPRAEFWVREVMDLEDTWVNHSTYKDNPYLEQTIKDELERRINTDENFHRVYALGLWGNLEGLIFSEKKNWNIIKSEDYPEEYDKRVICGDFGYSNDPTAVLDLRLNDNKVYARELVYQKGLLNCDIAEYLQIDKHRTVFDSAEPKSIAEIKKLGIDIHPSQKGKDSINNGINLIKEYPLLVTNDSTGLIKELRNYSWAKDRHGEQLGKPIDDWNHSIDALRYGMFDFFNRREVFFI